MERAGKIVWVIIGCVGANIALSALFWTFMFLYNYLFVPNPPKPEITYAEFPFVLELEVNGVYQKYEDVLICEFDGFGGEAFSSGYRQWDGYLMSRNDSKSIYKDDKIELFCTIASSSNIAGAMMGDEALAEYEIHTEPSLSYTYEYENGSIRNTGYVDRYLKEKYKIRLISWECAPPIKNTFK